MNKSLMIALIAVLCVGITYGQDTTPKTKQGDKAWTFTWAGLSTMGIGNYGAIATANGPVNLVGGKYYFNDGMALRAGIGFNSASSTPVLINGAFESKSSSAFGIQVGVQDNFSQTGPVVAYFGGQVAFGSAKPADTYNGTAWVSADSRSSLGIGVFTGVEWFPWSQISFAPEVGLMYTSQSNPKATVGGNQVDVPATTSLGFSTNAALAVSIYF